MQLEREDSRLPTDLGNSVGPKFAGTALAIMIVAGSSAMNAAHAAPDESNVPTQAAIGLSLDSHRGLLNTVHARIDHRYRESARRGTPKDGEIPSSAPPRLRISTNYGGMWFESYGVVAEQDEFAGITGYKSKAGGASVGLDSHAADNWIFGGMVGYGVSDADLFHDNGYIEGDTVYTGIYMSNISTTHFANLFLTAAVTTFDAEREVTAGLLSGTAEDSFGSYMWDARLELGRTFGIFDDDFIRPNIAVEYTSAYHDDYMDDGAGVDPGLLIEEHTTKLVRSEAQVDLLIGSQSFEDDGWSSRLYVGVAHEIFLDDRFTEATVTGLAPYTIGLGDDHRTMGIVGAALSFAVNQRMRTQLSYQGEVNTEFERHNVVLGFSVAW